ncbi:MAG: hypothetical protein KGL90_12555 [Burkholderiales bacterium]|nr:hypothetical protein [Burkholderiales bacterium]
MKSPLLIGSVALMLAFQVQAAAPSPERVAECVAALTTEAEPLAKKSRQGDAAADAQLTPLVNSAFSFIASAYKQGVGQAKADALLAEAKKAQVQMPAQDLSTLQGNCLKEGTLLMANANFIERAIIERAARARIERLKRSKKTGPAHQP